MNAHPNPTTPLNASLAKPARLLLMVLAAMLWVDSARAQGGALVNDGANAGTIGAGGTNTWTFTANAGDNVVLRLGTTNFAPNLGLFGPDGGLLATSGGADDTTVAFTLTNSGAFTAVVTSGNQGGAGSYVLHFARMPGVFTVPPGEQGGPLVNGGDNAGTLSLADLQMWSFTANAGDNIVLRLVATNFEGSLGVYGPDGALLGANCCGAGGDTPINSFTATNSGVFTVLVSAAIQGETGSYILRLAQFSQPFGVPSVPLSNGGDNLGNLVLGGLDRWTFTANTGDNVVLRMVTTNFSANPALYGPDGALLVATCCAAGGDTAIASFTATNFGVFTVLVASGNEGETGPYILRLAQFSQPFSVPSAPLSNGGDNLGNLALGGLDRWTFTANAGDNVVLRMVTTNFSASPALYGPDGALLVATCCAQGGDTLIDFFTATNSGVFTLLVISGNEGQDGPYAVRLAEFSQPFNVPSVPLANGGDNVGNLALGGLDRWTFTANAGDNVVLRMVATNFSASPALYGPGGALLVATCCAQGGDTLIAAFQATNSGVFTLLVTSGNDGQAGPYVVRLAQFSQPFSVPAVPLTNGGDNLGNLELGGLDRWSFTANAGDNVVLRISTTNFVAGPRFYGPDGTLLGANCCGAGGDTIIDYLTATNSGVFTVLVSSANQGDTGSYILRLAQFSQPFSAPAVPLTNGGDNVGNLGLGDLDRWTFMANAGDNVAVRMSTTNFVADARLYGPDGTQLGANCCGAGGDTIIDYFTATKSGVFTVLVSAANQGDTGPYILRLAQFSQPFSAPAFTPANGGNNAGILALGGLDRWSFSANAGDNVTLRLLTTNFTASAVLYGPDGTALFNVCCGAGGDTIIGSFTVSNSGVFTVLVTAANQGGIGSYLLGLVDFSQPFSVPSVPLTNGASDFGNLATGGLDRWEFTACVGDWINPSLGTTNFVANLVLYGPDGTLLASGNGTNIEFALAATNSGTFTLLVSSANQGESGAYELVPNGLSAGTKLCPPGIAPSTFTVTGIGGATNAEFILYTTPVLPTAANIWTSIYTNQFDRFGMFNYTNAFDPTLPPAYFRLLLP
jgi:hypothetical protein